MNEINPLDFRFVPADPDPNFSPEHNKRIVEDAIKKTDRLIRQKKRQHKTLVEERVWAMSHFLEATKQGQATSMDKFFGRKEVLRLKGQFILDQLKARADAAPPAG